jgi:hypothetical protein
MAWIKTRQDQTPPQIGSLFGHANNIGINQILLMPFEANGSYGNRVDVAAEQAWSQGLWLYRQQKLRLNKWCCINQQYNPEECTFDSSYYSGETRWV